jgi:hypothetical protein
VPINPAVNPDKAPPILPIHGDIIMLKVGWTRAYKAKSIKTHHSTIFRSDGSIMPESLAHTIVAIILGSPKRKNIFLSRCFQNNKNLEIFQNI